MLIRFFDRFLYLIFLESFGNNIYCATTDWNNTGYYTAGDYNVVPGDNCMEENNQISEQSTQHVTGFYDSNSFQNPYYSDSHLLEIVMNAGDNTALESCQYDKVPFQQYNNNDLTNTGLYDQTYEQNYLQNNETTLNYCDLYPNEIADQSFNQLPSASCYLSNYPQTQNSSISNTGNTEAYADQHISPLEYGIDQAFEQSIPQLTELNPYKYSESREIENAYENDTKVLNEYNFSRTEDETSSISLCNMQNTDFQKTTVDMSYTSTNPNIITQNESLPIIYDFDQSFMLPSTIETQNNPNPGIIYNNTYNDENAFNFTFGYANDRYCENEQQSSNSEVCTAMDGLIANDVRHQRKRKIGENDRLLGKNKTLRTNAETSINKSSISQVCKCCNNPIPILSKEEMNKNSSLIIRKRRPRSIPPNIKELRKMKFLRHETSKTLYRLTKFFRYKTIKEFIAKHDIKLKFRFTRNLGLLNIYYADWIEIHTLRGIIDLKNTLYIKFFEKEYAVFLKEMNDILYRINLQKKILHSATDYNKQHLIFDTLINILNEQLNITENNANYKLTILSWYLTRGMGDMHDRIDLKSLSCILNLDRSTFEITKTNESRMLHLLKLELSRIQFKAAIEVINIESAKVQHKNPDEQFLEEQSKKIYTIVLDSITEMDMYLASVENLFHHFKADITAIKNQSERCQNEIKMNWDKQV